ncbi:MAG TPA: type II toxin-antitoxin system CcdA family antitoxin [Acetobacteraceae bacterium]|jgi:post-segregation antitoxin (ccd killing protein)|nr:type II toxin-antitoxin system CcdA family antitoxin [Acetobacteraceae bacterium]
MDQDAGDARQALMVRSSLVEEARSRGVDIVQAAEAGIAHAVSRAADREAWRRENLPAMQDYNRHVAEHGLELDDLRLL